MPQMIVSNLMLANSIPVGGETNAYWDTKKGFSIVREADQISFKITNNRTGAYTFTTIFNVLYFRTPDGVISSNAPAPTYSEGEDDPGSPDEQQKAADYGLDAKGRPITKYGDRRPDGPSRAVSANTEPETEWKPDPPVKWSDRKNDRDQAAAANDVPKGKGKTLKDANREEEKATNES